MGRPSGPTDETREFVRTCQAILAEIQPTSVRSLCYQLFFRGLIPSMEKNPTSRVSDKLIRARERGEIPWAWLVDEHRAPERVPQWDDPADFLRTVRHAYRKDLWNTQPTRVEVWSEKGTVRGVLKPVLNEYGVDFRVMHGWGGGSDLYAIAQFIRSDPRPSDILYVGDLDCSGAYMSDVDLPMRLVRYGANEATLFRLAVTMEQTADLPSFAPKKKDTRYRWYLGHYGRRCWELDALDPRRLRSLVEQAIQERIDHRLWDRAVRAEEAEVHSIQMVLDNWTGRAS